MYIYIFRPNSDDIGQAVLLWAVDHITGTDQLRVDKTICVKTKQYNGISHLEIDVVLNIKL